MAKGSKVRISILLAVLTLSGSCKELTPPVEKSAAPVVISVSPDPVPGSDAAQSLSVLGSGFVSGLTVSLSWTGNPRYDVPAANVVVENAARLSLTITTTEAPDSWSVRVTNPDGQTSNAKAFTVVGIASRNYSDDYPIPYRSLNPNEHDPFLFYYRECTSFLAWRVNRDKGTVVEPFFFVNGLAGGRWGGAENWAANARSLGIRVDQAPSVGAIAQWGIGELDSAPGHVAYVERVFEDGSVDLTEYNYHKEPRDHQFDFRLNKRPLRYIHVESWPVYAISSIGLLYRVETSEGGRDFVVGTVKTATGTTPRLLDVASLPDGSVYAVAYATLYRINTSTAIATQIGSGLGFAGVNALGSDHDGKLFAATLSGLFLRVDVNTGLATAVGSYGSGFVSAGDLVLSHYGTWFATVQGTSGSSSILVSVDPATGVATRVGAHDTDSGFDGVLSLSTVGGILFGLTTDAEGFGSLVRFDTNSGRATFVRRIPFEAY